MWEMENVDSKSSSSGFKANRNFEPKFAPPIIPYPTCPRYDGIIYTRFIKLFLPYCNHQLCSEQLQKYFNGFSFIKYHLNSKL